MSEQSNRKVEAIYAASLLDKLDHLARNVHEWPVGNPSAFFFKGELNFTHQAAHAAQGAHLFTKQQWLDRRAELQNKPSWRGAPEWAEWLGQVACGVWEWYEGREGPKVHADSDCWDHQERGQCSTNHGEVLGDWRDTLERRPSDLSEQAVTSRLQEATDNVLAAAPELKSDKYKFEGSQPLTREQALQWAVDNVETWHKAPLGPWTTPFGWSWEQACGNIYLMQVGEPCIGEKEWEKAKQEPFTSREDAQPELRGAQLVGVATTLHTIHHAAFLHQDCQLLLNEPELVVFRTADGELIHCKPKECLIDPDVYGLAARLLADMSGHPVAPEHMREVAEQMNWRVE